MTGNELRKSFIKFFEEKKHKHFESASLIPDDKTLLLTVAGMVPFKSFFLGEKKAPFPRITTYQKCIRTNDLENVGITPRHHTFFEMLGNFSFGDYFKKEAILWSWEYITEILKLDPNRLYVSVYLTDDEAYNIWTKEVKVPETHMVRLGDDDNWWAAGPIGSCGPCSEIYYDTLNMGENNEEINSKPGDEGNRFLEIWNLVFTEWNRLEDGSLIPLPEKNIDTGAGLERIASVIQGKNNNFETDLFMPINLKVMELLKIDTLNKFIKIITDHLRASCFLIADGVLPSNEGRGYILKKLIRRAYGSGAIANREIFENSEIFLYKAVDSVIDNMLEAYPELEEKRNYIKNVIKNEEEKFSKTLKLGSELLFDEIRILKDRNEDTLSSSISFKLYDTYGFPFEFTKLIASNNNIKVFEEDFNLELEKQIKRSQDSRNKTSDMIKDEFIDNFYKENGKTLFTGYDSLKENAKILFVKNIEENIFEIIFDKTPFYAESGGQVADKGFIFNNEFKAEVIDVIKKSDIFIHIIKIIEGKILTENKEVTLAVDKKIRDRIRKNHTATHLLHKVLRTILGNNVEQAGSLVNENGLRFDFSYYEAISDEELETIENMVNESILENIPVYINYENINDAIKKGAMALFTDKYGDVVRVVDIDGYSLELCGGTHVSSTGEIGLFKILSEQGKASGIRRIEAITGIDSINYVKNLENNINLISKKLKSNKNNILISIDKLKEENKKLENDNKSLENKLLKYEMDSILNDIIEINNVKILVKHFKDKNIEQLKEISDFIKEKLKSCVILLATSYEKPIFLSSVSKDLTSKYNAGNIVKNAALITGGNGGGRPDFAQAGVKDIKLIDKALKETLEMIKNYE